MEFILVISACLISDPGHCKDFENSLYEIPSEIQCMQESFKMFPQWAADHPGWTIKKWGCTRKQTSNEKDKDI